MRKGFAGIAILGILWLFMEIGTIMFSTSELRETAGRSAAPRVVVASLDPTTEGDRYDGSASQPGEMSSAVPSEVVVSCPVPTGFGPKIQFSVASPVPQFGSLDDLPTIEGELRGVNGTIEVDLMDYAGAKELYMLGGEDAVVANSVLWAWDPLKEQGMSISVSDCLTDPMTETSTFRPLTVYIENAAFARVSVAGLVQYVKDSATFSVPDGQELFAYGARQDGALITHVEATVESSDSEVRLVFPEQKQGAIFMNLLEGADGVYFDQPLSQACSPVTGLPRSALEGARILRIQDEEIGADSSVADVQEMFTGLDGEVLDVLVDQDGESYRIDMTICAYDPETAWNDADEGNLAAIHVLRDQVAEFDIVTGRKEWEGLDAYLEPVRLEQ